MALTKVYPAPGRTVRLEHSRRIMSAEGMDVDLDTVFWHRRLNWGDITLQPPAATAAPVADAPAADAAPAATDAPAKTSSSKKAN